MVTLDSFLYQFVAAALYATWKPTDTVQFAMYKCTKQNLFSTFAQTKPYKTSSTNWFQDYFKVCLLHFTSISYTISRCVVDEMKRRREYYASHPEARPSGLEQCGEASYQHLLSPDETICLSLSYHSSSGTTR